MSLLNYGNVPRSRGSNRNSNQHYIGSSVNRRNDVNLLSQNYNNYYGAPSLSKDLKTPPTSYLSHLTSKDKDSLLPKITNPREEDRHKYIYSRESKKEGPIGDQTCGRGFSSAPSKQVE